MEIEAPKIQTAKSTYQWRVFFLRRVCSRSLFYPLFYPLCLISVCVSFVSNNKKKTKSSACENGACKDCILKNWGVHETENHVTGISKAVPLMASACFTLSTHFMLSIGTCNTTSCRHRNVLECVPFAITYRLRSWLQIIVIALGWWHDVFKWESRLSFIPPETLHIFNTWRWQTHIWMSIWPLSGHSSEDLCLV